MPSIDERIVSASFENRKFESAVSETLKTLAKLDATLQQVGVKNSLADIEKAAEKVTLSQPMSALDKLKARLFGASDGAAQGMSDIEKAGSKVQLEGPIQALDKVRSATAQVGTEAAYGFNEIERSSGRITLSSLSSSLDTVTAKFSVLRGAASVALGNIASQAAMRGASFAKSFAIAPIQQGFQEYQTNLQSIQTILANTQDSGGNLKTVNAALNELNTYSDKTIYNFSEMARNIGTFTAAGVRLKPATAAIKGIANLAALSGSNSQQASTAMYQLSQAIAAGRVGLQDWNSVVNAGMGGAVFQKSLMRTAENMGALKKGAVEVDKATGKATVNGQSFRESIMAKPGEQSWLTSDVLTKTLSQFTGDMSNAQLAAQGFSKEQIKAIQLQAKSAQNAATQVKTLPQVFDVAKETIGSGWSKTFQLIFGNKSEATKTFTKLSNTINGFINNISNARNKVLQTWHDLGGRAQFLQGIENMLKGIFAWLKPIKDAFRDIFPAKTGKDLFEMTKNFAGFAKKLTPSATTIENIRRTFKGFFALLDIGRKIIFGVFTVFSHMFGAVSSGTGSLLSFTATVGDLITYFRNWLDQGDRLQKFFGALGSVLAVPAKLISVLIGALSSLFSTDLGGSSTVKDVTALSDAMNPLTRLGQAAAKAWDGVVNALKAVANFLQPVTATLRDALSQIGAVLSDAFSSGNVDKMLAGIQTGLIAGIFLSIRKALTGGTGFNFKAEIGGLSDALGIMTGSLKSMQTAIKANTLLQIAAAVGILAFSVAILAKADSKKIASSMTAMAVGLGQLVGAMAILGKTSGKGGGFLKLPVIAASMILLSTALAVLTGTMLLMSRMDWGQIAKGLAGVSGLLLGLSVAVEPLSKGGPGLIFASTGMIAIGLALTVLAGAMKIFATMKWEEMAKGLSAIFLTISAIGIASRTLGPQLLLTGPGLILLAVGLAELAGVIKLLGTMDVGTLAKGIGAIAAGLVAIGLAMSLMPITLPVTAAGLILVGAALSAITGVIALLGHMKVETLAKGIGAIGAALAVLAIGLTLMVASLPGAAALLVASTALAIFAPTLALMGELKWSTIAKGLAVVAASMLVIGTTGLIAAPALILLGVGFAALGAGVLAIGAGVNLLAKGFALLGNSGKGLAVFTAAIVALIAVIPKIAIEFVKGIVDIADSVVKLAPPLVAALAQIIDILIALVIKETPKFGLAVLVFIQTLSRVIINSVPAVVAAGVAIILGLLRGIDQNIEEFTNRAISIVTKFLGVLASHAVQFTAAGVKFVVNVLNGIASKAGRLVGAATRLLTRFLGAIAAGLPKVIVAGAKILGSIVSGIAQGLVRMFNIGTRAVLRFLAGISENVPKVIDKGVEIAGKFVRHVARGLVRLVDVGATAIINFINGLADVIRTRGPELRAAGLNLAKAIMDGMTFGISKYAHKPIDAIKSVGGSVIGGVKSIFKSHSPSQVFHEIGQDVMLGLSNGLQAGGLGSEKVVARTANNLVAAVQKTMADIPVGLDDAVNLNPVISPVLDLSSVHKEAQNMPNMTSSVGLSTDVSLQQASAILAEKAAADKAQTESAKTTEKPSITFEQNNYSPESLSETEIYRRTKNQLSRVKKQLHAAPA